MFCLYLFVLFLFYEYIYTNIDFSQLVFVCSPTKPISKTLNHNKVAVLSLPDINGGGGDGLYVWKGRGCGKREKAGQKLEIAQKQRKGMSGNRAKKGKRRNIERKGKRLEHKQ
jgi:hypothetical protein